VASYERKLGQDLLASELQALTFWQLDRSGEAGWMSFAQCA